MYDRETRKDKVNLNGRYIIIICRDLLHSKHCELLEPISCGRFIFSPTIPHFSNPFQAAPSVPQLRPDPRDAPSLRVRGRQCHLVPRPPPVRRSVRPARLVEAPHISIRLDGPHHVPQPPTTDRSVVPPRERVRHRRERTLQTRHSSSKF